MSLPIHVALTSDVSEIESAQLTGVAAALSKQVLRDFQPVWRVDATVDAFVKLEDVPIDYWPIIVKRQVEGAAGFHQDENGQPFALVEFGQDWSLTASHECLEMLADPFGRRLRAGNIPDQAIGLGFKPSRVQFLVEVCDPSEGGQFSYQVNGVVVSDFYTPHYFDPVRAPGVQYSFTGVIDAPRKVLDGGYISYRDPVSKHWFQVRMFPDQLSAGVPHVVDLTEQTAFGKLATQTSLRSAIDRVTPQPPYRDSLHGSALMAARLNVETATQAQVARAESLRAQVQSLVQATQPKGKRAGGRKGSVARR